MENIIIKVDDGVKIIKITMNGVCIDINGIAKISIDDIEPIKCGYITFE